jgi:hypothetical protein
MVGVHQKLGNRGCNPPKHCQFQNTDRGNPDRRKGDPKEFPMGGKLPDREIGEFQENPKNTEPDRVQEICEVEMSFVLVRISFKHCGLFMEFNGLTILNWIAQCVFIIQ